MAAQYELLSQLLKSGGRLDMGQELFYKFYQAFVLKDRWLQYIGGVGTTLLVTAIALAMGVLLGSVVALEFACPLVFAKKSKTKNIAGDVYKTQVASFTHGTTYDVMVSKRFLTPEDRVLIVDDFLAVGNALRGLIDLVHQSGATLVGCGTVIEKGYQHGGDQLRAEGVRVESLAIVESMDHTTGQICFRD